MIYLAMEIVWFLVGAFVLGWWFGRQQRKAVDLQLPTPQFASHAAAVKEPG